MFFLVNFDMNSKLKIVYRKLRLFFLNLTVNKYCERKVKRIF